MIDGILTGAAVAVLLWWVYAVVESKTVRQIHHGWLLLFALSSEPPVWIRALALAFGIDDAYQHTRQLSNPAYLSPVHRAFELIARTLVRLFR